MTCHLGTAIATCKTLNFDFYSIFFKKMRFAIVAEVFLELIVARDKQAFAVETYRLSISGSLRAQSRFYKHQFSSCLDVLDTVSGNQSWRAIRHSNRKSLK